MTHALIEFVPIPDVKPEWETAHEIRFLSINGVSRVIENLQKFKKAWPDDYRDLLVSIKIVAENPQVRGSKRVKRCKGCESILEMKGKALRLFFFYAKNGTDIVVCTGTYRKGKGLDKKQQQNAIAAAEKLRTLCRRETGV
jgi:hypothetical protein